MLSTLLTAFRPHKILARYLSYFYKPSEGHGLAHDPFKAIVAPRPIGWISTQDNDGNVNLAPYSFYNAFNGNPPIVGFSSEGDKDTLANVTATGEFAVNMATFSLVQQMNITSASVKRGVDEMQLANLTAAPGNAIKVPHVAESPAVLECKLLKTVPIDQDKDGNPLKTTLVLGQVVGVHINKAYIKDGIFDLQAADPVMRGGYAGDYYRIGEKFAILRPNKDQIAKIIADGKKDTISTIIETEKNPRERPSFHLGK